MLSRTEIGSMRGDVLDIATFNVADLPAYFRRRALGPALLPWLPQNNTTVGIPDGEMSVLVSHSLDRKKCPQSLKCRPKFCPDSTPDKVR